MKFDPNVTYLLSGGLGGLGRAIAEWMVSSGAKNIVFLSRSGESKREAKETIAKLSKAGTRVAAIACDIGNAEQLNKALEQCKRDFPEIRGVVQGAMSLSVRITSLSVLSKGNLSTN